MANRQVGRLRACESFLLRAWGVKYGCALVQPFDIATRRTGDVELGLCRIKKQAQDKAVVIPIRAIIRGAIVVEDKVHAGEYTVMDMTDGDMYLRLMSMFPGRDIETDISIQC